MIQLTLRDTCGTACDTIAGWIMTVIKELDISMIEEIKALFADIFTKEPWNDDWSDAEQLHAYITDLIGNRNSLSLGLYEDGELIGLSLGSIMHWCRGTEYYILEFCIKTDRQGRGLGSFFLTEAQRIAEERGATHIFLQTERTVPAYAFYRKNGFSELTDHVSLVKAFKHDIKGE